MARDTGAAVVEAATTPHWGYLVGAFLCWAAIQPLRAWAWSITLQQPVGFRAIYAASSVGSFLDTVLPGRLGEVSKVGLLRVASGARFPGFCHAGGSLLCKHLLDGIGFTLVGAAAAFFLPLPTYARAALVAGSLLATVGMILGAALRRRISHRLPRSVDNFFAGATAPLRVLVRGGLVVSTTWLVKWIAVFCMLHAVGVKATLGAAMLYLLITAIAGIAPLLPGNAGIYQGAAMGALALVGHAGGDAVAATVLAPAVGSIAAAAAALVALALYGRRFAELPRAAFARS